MTIEAQLFDGTILQFPDDTDRSVIDSTVKKLTAERQQAEPEEKQSRLREVADVPLSVGKGAVQGVRFIADAFGAENPISKNLRGVEDYLGGLMSAQAKNDQQEIARIMKDAEDKGVLEQVKAGIKAFTVAPVDLLSQAFGTIAPVVVGGLAGGALRLGATATGLATGATMGAGSIKGGIYDAVKEELSKTNLPPDQIEQRAILAQEYGGENLDQILLGAGIGGLSAITGAEAALVPAMARRIAAKAAQKSTTARAIGTGGKEFFTEGLQGGQEQVSQNVALQREGYDVPTYQGAVGAGTLEGLAGLGMGTAVGAFSRPQAPYVPPEPTPEIAPEAPAEIAPEAPILTQAPAAPLTPEQERQLAIDQQIARQNAFQAQFGEPAVATETPQQAYERQMAQQAQRTPVRPVTEPQPISPFLGVGEAAIQPGQRERAQGLAAQEFGLNVGQARPQVTEQDRIARQLAAQQEMDADRFQQQSPLPPVTPAQAQPRTPAPIPSARAIDRQAELLGQREGLPAIEQAGLSAQADVAGGTGQVAVPQTRFVDLTPMPPRAARQKLAALKADAPDADLNIVPHPEMSGRFAIEERVAPAPEAPVAPRADRPSVSYEQAVQMVRDVQRTGVLTPEVIAAAQQYGLNIDPMLMQFAERTTPESPLVQQRRGMADEAALDAELRGGIATPEEAQRLREAGMGRPYDEVASLEPRAPAELGKGERQRRLEEEALAERDAAIREHFKNLQGPELWLEGFELGLNPKSAIQTASPKFKEIFLKPEGRYSLVTTATPEARAAVENFLKEAMPMLKRFGLEKVGLRLVDSIKNGEAEGMYAQQIITIALDSDNPLGVMRHEVIHALKELGAFTPAEWKVLSKAAKDKWIDQFFSPELQQQYKDVYLEHNGDLNGFDAYMQEEAIAQAFRFYTETKPPAGRIANIMRRLNEFFAALRNFLNGRGFQNIDEMFLPNRILADIERGAITPGREKGRKEELPVYSLKPTKAPEGVPQEIYNLHQKYERITAMANGRIPAERNAKGVYPRPQDLKREETMSFRRLLQAVENFTGDRSGEPSGASMQMLAQLSELSRAAEDTKFSLRSHAVEIVSNDIAKPEIEGKVTVDKVGQYFDNKVLSEFGRKLDYKNDEDFARAVAQADDEIAFQLAQENSGLDWYEEDVKKAFEYTAQVIPELNSEQKRLLFSVMAGIMSPQTNARDNWFIAAKAFQHYIATNTIPGKNPETGGLWQGGTQSANKKVQLDFLNNMVADLGERQALEWLTGQHSVKEVNEFRQKYGNIKSGIGGKATDQVIGLYAFGPKVGPFVSNLNGIHDVTVDKWMTRTFNRYFGTMVDADGKIIDAPTEPQRKAVKQLVNEAAQNANIKPYQVQSLLWFFEQRLFRELGTPAPSYGFSDGGRKFLESATGGDEKGRRGASAQAPKFSLKAPTTPAFKKWFGDSKVVDENGKPLVVYHGTDVNADDTEAIGGGISVFRDFEPVWFSKDPYLANIYVKYEEEAPAVYPAYLSIKKPFTITQDLNSTIADFRNTLFDKLGLRIEDFNLTETDQSLPIYSLVNTAQFSDALRMRGYDGMIANEQGYKTYAVLDSRQIKSATGNQGTFDSGVQDIRYSLRAPKTPEFKRFFGNSKIVNPDGTPKVMYHGTARIIDEFIPKQAGAIFVTDNPEFAETFAKDSIQYQVQEQTGILRQAFSKMNPDDQLDFLKKAYKLGVKQKAISKAASTTALNSIEQDFENNKYPTTREFNDVADFFEDEIKKDLQSGQMVMPLYVRAENPFDYENAEHIAQLVGHPSFDVNLGHNEYAIKSGSWKDIEQLPIQDIIKDLGHDGFYIKEGGQKNLAVYNPNQIKSATGNRGTYDETGRILYSLKNAPPNRYTKLAPDDPTAGKAVIDAATSAFNAVRNDGTRTSARINLVDRFSGLSRTLESIPLFSDGKLRADMLHHAKAQGINLIKGGLLSGTPILNDDGTIGIERSENNLARAAYVADSINSNKNVIDSGLSGRALIGEVARILRGADILAEDAELRKLGEQQLREADAMAAQLKAEKNQMSARQIADMQKEIDSKRAEGNANRKMNRELQVKPEDIAWAKKQLDLIPEVQEVLDIWKNVNTSLVNLWEATGLLDKETADKYRAAKNYVPLFKSREDLNEESFFQTGSGAKTTAKVKKLEGADITRNIWENVDKQYAVMIAAAYENQTRRASVEQMRGIDPKLAEITNASDPRVNLRYRDGGKDVHVVIENPNDLAAFQSMSYQLSPIMKFLGGFTNVLRAGALLNPMFWIRQLIRDPIHASIAGQSGIITPVHSAAEFLRIITQNSEEARILASRGVIGQFDSTVSLNEFLGEVGKDKQKPPGAVQRGLHKLMQIHEASDAATRVAIFKKAKAKALKDGMSEAQAIDYAVFKARESINFALTGNSPTLANVRHMIPFLNATIVGLDTLYRAAFGYGLNPEEKAEAKRMFRNRAMMLTAMSFAYAMSMQDDDDYKKLPDYVKDGNWLIPTSTDAGKTFVKVSVPYEVGFLFKTLPELLVRYMAGTSTGKETLAAFRTGLIHNMPTGGVPIPQFAKPALEVVTNHSFFTNRPIEGMGDSRLPVAQRGQKASEFAKMMSSLGLDEFGLSPAKIDALSKGYFAEFGTFFNELTDALIIAGSGGQKTPRNIENLPFMKAFLTDPLVNKAIGDFYQIETSATETANLFTKYKNEGQGEQLREMIADPDKAKQVQGAPVLRQISKSMSDIQKAIRIIDANKSIDPEERRERINQLQTQLGQLAERGRQVADSIGLSR